MIGTRGLQLVEFLYWVLAVTGIVVGGSLVVGYVIGGDFITVKYTLFLIGVSLFGIGAFGLQPTSPKETVNASGSERGPPGPVAPEDERRFGGYIRAVTSTSDVGEHRLEAYIQSLPPLRHQPLRFDQRVRRSVKLFVTGLVVLGVSAILEFVLGVRIS